MGNFPQKLIQLGEYCDCLQNWKKFQIQDDQKSQNQIYTSEDASNVDIQIQKAFEVENIEHGFEKQLQIMHQRLKKRKKIKNQYLKQKQQERIQRQIQQQNNENQRLKKIRQQKQQLQQNEQFKKSKDNQQNQTQQPNLKPNKKHKRGRTKARHNGKDFHLKINGHNKSLSTTDQNAFIFKNDDQIPGMKDSVNEQNENGFQKEIEFQNIFDRKQYAQSIQNQKRIQTYRRQKKPIINDLEIIDLEKLNPASMNQQVQELVLKKIKFKKQSNPISQSVPLNVMAIHSHRPQRTRYNDLSRNHLKIHNQTQSAFQSQIPQFIQSQNKGLKNQNNLYFLDSADKEQYLKQMFN